MTHTKRNKNNVSHFVLTNISAGPNICINICIWNTHKIYSMKIALFKRDANKIGRGLSVPINIQSRIIFARARLM